MNTYIKIKNFVLLSSLIVLSTGCRSVKKIFGCSDEPEIAGPCELAPVDPSSNVPTTIANDGNYSSPILLWAILLLCIALGARLLVNKYVKKHTKK
jgi:hypothetical protein